MLIAAALAPVCVANSTREVLALQSENPDAELIRLCDAYIKALDAYGLAESDIDPDADPLWQAIEALEEHLNGLTARTLEGVVALAKVAQRWALQPDGSENFDTAYTADWPERVVLNVLAIQAEGRT